MTQSGRGTDEAQLRAAEAGLAIVVGLLAGGVFAATTLASMPALLLAVPIALAAGGTTAAVVGGIRRRVLDAERE